MNNQKRQTVIAGNWKMNKNPLETKETIEELAPLVKDAKCGVVLCVPFLDIAEAVAAAKGSNIKIGAQNCHWADKGAFTGEIPASLIKEAGCDYVIIGHSERRQYFGETDKTVNARVRAALDAGLHVILCCGELLLEREQDITYEIVARQLKIALAGISCEELSKIIIAYEPVWAIGTGLTATNEEAADVCKYIRSLVSGLYGEEYAEKLTIQYGGSVSADTAAGLLAMEDVDGALVGGASLKAKSFAAIVNAVE